MKEKHLSFLFENYIALLNKLTGCHVLPDREISTKRMVRFFEKTGLNSGNIPELEATLRKKPEIFNMFLEIFIPLESHFFRENDYLNLAIKLLMEKKLKTVLSLPCAKGEEVYSLKIIALEKGVKDVEITGIDISEYAIKKAKKGLYPSTSLNKIPLTLKEKYFIKEKEYYLVKDKLKHRVQFFQENILTLNIEKMYDIILCRNLLMYFSEKTRRKAIMKLYEAMKKNAFLIPGKSEIPLFGNFNILKREEKGKLIYFKKV